MKEQQIPGSEHTSRIHQGQPVAATGALLHEAKACVILAHGRGASARDILSLAEEFRREDIAWLAPQAGGSTWYPHSFLAPLAQNEPELFSGIQALGDVLRQSVKAGIPAERTVLLGFSQGACLALEFAARNARRYGGVIAFSGGLIGSGQNPGVVPPDDKTFDYGGDLEGAPVFLGCGDRDPHIPLSRVHTTARVMRALGAEVTERIYPGMGHTINEDELTFVRNLLAAWQ